MQRSLLDIHGQMSRSQRAERAIGVLDVTRKSL